MKPYLAQIKSGLQMLGRDRGVLFFSVLFPLIFFFVFAQMFGASKSPGAMAQVIAAVLIIGVLGNGFFGAGMRTVQDRETNVLRRFKVAPINASPIIIASLVTGLVTYLPVVLLLLFFSVTVYHAPLPPNVLSLLLFVSVGVLSFRAMGMIIAAVVNSAQEGQILIQILYLPMLFLSGATFPISAMPVWLQTIAQFLPATYLHQGIESILIGGETIASNWFAVIALTIALCVAVFIGVKLFRWEKEEKIEGRAKLWILAVLAPFFLLGLYQAKTKSNITKERTMARAAARNQSILFQNVRIFVGNGPVVANGAVLVRNGKIAQVFSQPVANPAALQAEVVESAGKTLMPGLIDMHVHIGAPGGLYKDARSYSDPNLAKRRLAAYLYSGVTTVRSTGDWLDNIVELRRLIQADEYEGASLYSCGPLFTAAGGHPTELLANFPETMKKSASEQFVRLPKSPEEARQQVGTLKDRNVDCIKAVLESGNPVWGEFPHLDPAIYSAIADEAHKLHLPLATHTGNAVDVTAAVGAGSQSIEHGSTVDLISSTTFASMKAKGLAYDPTISVFEGVSELRSGRTELLNRPLLQQVGPLDLLQDTRAEMAKRTNTSRQGSLQPMLDYANRNLMAAYRAGVTLIAGSDAGNMLVIHGPTVQHELALWVKAGIPTCVALQAATANSAQVLGKGNSIGTIAPGSDATLILVDGDPTTDIQSLEHISTVMLRGQRINRSDLFEQDKP